MGDFNMLGESIWNQEEEHLREKLFHKNVDHFLKRIQTAKTIGVCLTDDTICETWRMAEAMLVLVSFHGCVYVEYRGKDWYKYVPYVTGYGRQAQYQGYGCSFAMVMLEQLSQAPAPMEYVFQGAGTPEGATAKEGMVCLLSLSDGSQGSFFLYPYDTGKPETGRQRIYYDLCQFEGQQDVEKLPYYRISESVCEAVSEEIHAWYKNLPQAKQAASEAEQLLEWMDGQAVVVPMVADSYDAFEDAVMLALAVALNAGEECTVIPLFYQTCGIDSLLEELADATCTKAAEGTGRAQYEKAMEQFLKDRRELLPKLYEQSHSICRAFAQAAQSIVLKKPVTIQAGKVYVYAAGGFPQRYIDRVFYSAPGLSMADRHVYPASCHRPVTMPAAEWRIPEYLLDGRLDHDAAWVAGFYQNIYQAMHCPNGYDRTLAVLADFVQQSKDKSSRLWKFFARRGEVLAGRYQNKFFRAVHLLESSLHVASPIRFRAASPYEPLYEALSASVQARRSIRFEEYVQLSALAGCLRAVAASTQVKVENTDSIEYERTDGDQGEICAIVIQDASFEVNGCLFEGFFRLYCCWDDDTFDSYACVGTQQVFSPPGVPWLALSQVKMELCVQGQGGEPMLSVNGVMQDAGLYLCVDRLLNSGCYQFRGGFYGNPSALEAVSALCGGADILSELPEPLRELGGLGIRSFTIDYSPAHSKVERFTIELGVEQAWTVLDQPLLTVNPCVCLEVYNPADFSARSFHVSLTGDCVIGEGNGVLRLSGSYSPLILHMELLEGEAYSVKTLLSDCGIADCGCDLKIDTLRLTAVPSQGSYRFAVSVCDVLKLGQFSIDSVGLFLMRSRGGFSAAFAGSLTVCGVKCSARAGYAQASGWTLRAVASFGEAGVSAKELIEEYGSIHRDALAQYGASDEEIPNPLAAQVQVSYASAGGYWSVSAAIRNWEMPFASGLSAETGFFIGEDASGFSCRLSGTCIWQNIELCVGYSYLAGENCFTLRWNTLEGRVVRSDTQCYADLSLSDMNLGMMVETMVEWVSGTAFGLSEPWNELLGKITLNCALRYDFVKKSVSLSVRFHPLDVGFARIDGVCLAYQKGEDGAYGAFVSLSGDFPWMQGDSPQWDASRPETAPSPNGSGNAYFDLRLLVLGHHVGLFEGKTPATVQETVTLLRGITPDVQPPYSDAAEWLAAADFGILRQDNGNYFIDAQIVFYDPLLYALRIRVGGILEGLVFDILYTRMNDTLGVFRGSVTLPDRIRRLTIGAYTLVLPVFCADIYTDGSFLLDFGFPAGGDFSNALSFEGMAGPIPIMGAAGFYIGRFSQAAGAGYVPATTKGVFAPVTAFGFGIRFGIGKSVDAGVLKAGFSLTMTAILEGVFARFSPYLGETADYYRVSGRIGVEGGLYGIIDFAVLSASVSAAVSLSAAFALEAYRACTVQVHAEVAVSALLTIHLWLFKITISFRFHADVSASFTIGENQAAPWDENSLCLTGQEAAVLAAVLVFDNLKPAEEPLCLSAHIALPLSVTDRPCRQVTAALLLTVSADGFAKLTKLLLAWLTAAATKPAALDEIMASCPQKETLESICAALCHDEVLPTEELYLFLQRFLCLQVVSEEALRAAPMQVDGVFFPFPPDTQVNSRPLSDCGTLSAKTLDAMKDLFASLSLSMEDGAKTNFRRGDKEMSAAEWLFRDYFVFLARQLCRDAAARADGKTMLSDIWETLDTAGIGGMVSRYQLHGLRIPFAGIDGCTEGTEQPVLALAGTLFTRVRQTDRFAVSCSRGWLDIPVSYEVKPVPDTYAMLAAFIENAKAEPQCKIVPEAPSSAPVAISFGGSYRLGGRTVWDIPTALPRGGEAYTLRFEPQGEGQTALILALTLQKTDTPGVYAICAGTADSAASLAELVRKSCPIEGAELYYKENGSYQKADTECIMAARLDLSTQTHPPQNVSAGRNAQDPSYVRLAVLLFEALAANNGGYLLIAPAKIPELAFDAQGRADMLLMLLFAEGVHATERAASAVILRGTAADSEDVVLTAFAQRSRYKYALTAQSNSVVNVECAVHRTFPQEEADTSAQAYVENLYSILRYCVSVDGAAPDCAYSAPVSFTEDGMYRFALPADRLVGGGDYAAVGHTLAVHCQWLDLFGNLWGDGFTIRTVCGYKDALVSASEWPYMRMYFTVEGHCAVLYALPAGREEIPASEAAQVQAAYARILRQLQDENGIAIQFLCPVLGVSGNVPLSLWAKKAAAYFQDGGCMPRLCASFEIARDLDSPGRLELQRISASIRIARKGEPQKGFEQVQHVKAAESEVPVPDNVRAFAQAYEAAAGTVRVVTDGKRLYEMPDLTGRIRLEQAHIYAPMPFFQTLYSGTAHAYRYQKKQGLVQTTAVYTGADGGRLAAKALHCIDQVFTADIAAAAVLGGHLTGTENLMERMEEVKKRLARLLAARLRRMEKHTEAADKEKQPPKEVEEAFYQLMLSKLSNYFQIRAAATLDAFVDISREHARLYGKIQGESKAYGLEFGSAKLKLQSGKNQLAALVKGPETIFDRQGAAISYTDLEFGYTITHIEDHITEVVDGYESSVWLSGASNGALASLTAQGSVRLEFPVLYFPEAPVFTRQQFILEEDFTVRYSVAYAKSRHLPQVEDEITVIYQPKDLLRADKNALADAFAGFDCAGEQILQTLHQTAAEVIAGGQEAQSSVLVFAAAMDAMDTLCTDLEKALQDKAVRPHAQIPGRTVSFRVSEGEKQGAYAVTVNRQDITPLIEGYCTECVQSDTGAAIYLFEKNGEYLGTAEGQAILERTFLLPKEKIMDVHAATAQMYAKINGSLAEEFVMRTDMIAAGGIARADFTISETIDLHRKYKEPDLEKALQKFLLDIGGSLEVSAECRRIDANGAEFPLFMQLPVHNDPNSLSALWSRKISQWLDQLPQALKKEACFAFRLNLSFGDVLKIPHVIVYQQYD